VITVYGNTQAVPALNSAVRVNGTVNGAVIDMYANAVNFRDILFIVQTATLTDGSIAVSVQESPDNESDYVAVPSGKISGTLPTIADTASNQVFSFGVVPTMRYVKLLATTSGATTGGVFSAVAVLGNGDLAL
jgi:hypothetical protein